MIRIFENEQLNISLQTIRHNDQFYFKAKEVALALGYKDAKDAIKTHVPSEHRKRLCDLSSDEHPMHPHTCFLSEFGLCFLVFGSKMPAAKEMGHWIVTEVLPISRQPQRYVDYDVVITKKNTFEMKTEFDLHRKVVEYIRRYYPDLLFIAGLGELQDTPDKRIKSWQKGYQKGQPDLIITSYHPRHRGLCLEFKTPKGNGRLSEAQEELLDKYEVNGYKVMVSNDYDDICRCIYEYCQMIPKDIPQI